MSYKSLQYLLRKLKVSIFWQMKQKCENLSVTVAMVEIVCNIFLTKLRILQKLILHKSWCKSGFRYRPEITHQQKLDVSFFWQIKQKCATLSLKAPTVKSVCIIFFASPFILPFVPLNIFAYYLLSN